MVSAQGRTVQGVAEIIDRAPTPEEPSADLASFFAFRMFLMPRIGRVAFLVWTVLVVCAFIAQPVMYFIAVYQHNGLISVQVERQEQLERFKAEYAKAQPTIREIEKKIREYERSPDHTAALKEQQAELEAAQRTWRDRATALGLVGPSDADRGIAACRDVIALHRRTGPSVQPFLFAMLGAPFAWLGGRIFLEVVLVLFCIHERLTELVQLGRARGG